MLDYVTLTGTYHDGSGTPLSGSVAFVPTAKLEAPADDVGVPQEPIQVVLDAEGSFSLSLLATDNTDVAPAGWAWTVVERVGQTPADSWNFFLSVNTHGLCEKVTPKRQTVNQNG